MDPTYHNRGQRALSERTVIFCEKLAFSANFTVVFRYFFLNGGKLLRTTQLWGFMYFTRSSTGKATSWHTVGASAMRAMETAGARWFFARSTISLLWVDRKNRNHHRRGRHARGNQGTSARIQWRHQIAWGGISNLPPLVHRICLRPHQGFSRTNSWGSTRRQRNRKHQRWIKAFSWQSTAFLRWASAIPVICRMLMNLGLRSWQFLTASGTTT